MQIFLSDLFVQLWDGEKAHKAVGAAGWSKQCCQNMQNKGRTQKREREGKDKHSLAGKLLSVQRQRGVESLERNFYT